MATNFPVQDASIPFAGLPTRTLYAEVRRKMMPWWASPRITVPFMVIVMWYMNGGFASFQADLVFGVILNVLGTGVIIAFFWGLTTFLGRRQWKQVQALHGEIAGQIGVEGLTWSTPFTTNKFPWSKLVKVRHHPELLLFFYTANCAFYVPKAFFNTEAAWNDAYALASEQFSAARVRC